MVPPFNSAIWYPGGVLFMVFHNFTPPKLSQRRSFSTAVHHTAPGGTEGNQSGCETRQILWGCDNTAWSQVELGPYIVHPVHLVKSQVELGGTTMALGSAGTIYCPNRP
jgi:hypothetical protein